MYKVLIAEDEMLVRLGLKNSINWESFGMTIIGDASNGKEAYQIYKQFRPDLIITDVKMPIMDGMELISAIREEDKGVRIIILTCLEEFEIARKAMSHQVSEYILKMSMTTDDISEVLRRTQIEMDSSRSEKIPVVGAKLESIKETLLKEFLFLHKYSEQEFWNYTTKYGIRVRDNNHALCLLELDSFELLRNRFQDERGQLIHMSVLNVLNEILAHYDCGEAIYDQDERYLICFSFENKEFVDRDMPAIIEHMRKIIETYFNVTFKIAVSSTQCGAHKMKHQYSECNKLMGSSYLLETGAMMLWDEHHNIRLSEHAVNQLQILRKESAFVGSSFQLKLDMLHEQLNVSPSESIEYARQLFIQLLHAPITLLQLTIANGSNIILKYSEGINQSKTITQMVEVCRKFIAELQQNKLFHRQLSPEVHTAINYIQHHYSEEITLTQVSEKVQLSPNYMTSLIKKEIGMSLVDYLLHYRIEKAKELLMNTNKKSYEVSLAVGFSDHSYFSRTFKRLTGSSPKEFRKIKTSEGAEDSGHEVF